MPQHRVGLLQSFHTLTDHIQADPQRFGQLLLPGLLPGQKFVEGWIQQPNGHRITLHSTENPFEILTLEG